MRIAYCPKLVWNGEGSRLLASDGSRQEADFEGITVFADLAKGHLEVSGSKRADGRFDFAACDYGAGPQD